jgi:hypothetical protein
MMNAMLYYTSWNVVLFIVAIFINHNTLRAFVACNSLFILCLFGVFTHTHCDNIHLIYKKLYGPMYNTLLASATDFATHVFPMLLSWPWLTTSTVPPIVAWTPVLTFFLYSKIAPIEKIYLTHTNLVSPAGVVAMSLYALSFNCATWLNHN